MCILYFKRKRKKTIFEAIILHISLFDLIKFDKIVKKY